MDFKGAFDNLDWNAVMRRLNEVECEEIDLWSSYFSNIKVCVRGVRVNVYGRILAGVVHRVPFVGPLYGT